MQTLTPNAPWWHEDILTIDKLLVILDQEKVPLQAISNSVYVIAGKVAIRLFNSREYLATVPALLPSLKHYKHKLGLTSNPEVYYHNIKPLKHDYKNGKRTTNAKTDLIIQRPQEELALLGLDIMELFNDNNSSKL